MNDSVPQKPGAPSAPPENTESSGQSASPAVTHTFAGDIQKTVRAAKYGEAPEEKNEKEEERDQRNETLRKVAARKLQEKQKKANARKRAVRSRMLAGLLGVSFALAVGGGLYFLARNGLTLPELPSFSGIFSGKDKSGVEEFPFPALLIEAKSQETVVLSPQDPRSAAISALAAARAGHAGAMLIYPTMIESSTNEDGSVAETERLMTAGEFFGALDVSVSSTLARSITSFAYGTLGNQEQSPFFVARVDSFDEAFGALYDWERTMGVDLAGLIHFSRGALFGNNAEFTDIVVSNVDARALQITEEGSLAAEESAESSLSAIPETILLYAFPEKNLFVIAPSEAALQEILSRIE